MCVCVCVCVDGGGGMVGAEVGGGSRCVQGWYLLEPQVGQAWQERLTLSQSLVTVTDDVCRALVVCLVQP